MSKLPLSCVAVPLVLAIAAPAFAADPAPNAAPATSSTPETPAPAKVEAAPVKADVAPAKADAVPTPEAIAPLEGDAAPKKNLAQDPVVHTRRGGFTVGFAASFGVGPISGYPLDVAKLGKAKYLTQLDAGTGANGTLWIGGALTDWLVFGLGAGGTYSVGSGAVVKGYTFVFHTEAYPLFWAGGPLREIGIAFDTGAGQITGESEDAAIAAKGPLIDSGAASRVGASLFYEGLRLWKVSAGPFAAFDYTWSSSLRQPLFLVGFRTALYSGAPKK